jgi:hypothetical protein
MMQDTLPVQPAIILAKNVMMEQLIVALNVLIPLKE